MAILPPAAAVVRRLEQGDGCVVTSGHANVTSMAFAQIFAMPDAALQKFALPERGRFAAAEDTNA
jgi:hypothetical protein